MGGRYGKQNIKAVPSGFAWDNGKLAFLFLGEYGQITGGELFSFFNFWKGIQP
jgi:hypothetical protein